MQKRLFGSGLEVKCRKQSQRHNQKCELNKYLHVPLFRCLFRKRSKSSYCRKEQQQSFMAEKP